MRYYSPTGEWAKRVAYLFALFPHFFSFLFFNFNSFLYLCPQKPRKEWQMGKYEIPFLTACIQAFGRRFSMTRQAAFRYLHEHKGLAFLIEFYDVEHLQSMDETIEDLLIVCQKNGGALA